MSDTTDLDEITRKFEESFTGRWSLDLADSMRQARALDVDPLFVDAIVAFLVAANELIMPTRGSEVGHSAVTSARSWAARGLTALDPFAARLGDTVRCGIHGESTTSGRCPSCDREAITSARTALAGALGYEVDEHGRAIAPPLSDLVEEAAIRLSQQERSS